MKALLSQFKLDNRVRLGFVAGLLLLLFSLLIISFTKRQLVSQRNMVASTNEVILKLETIESRVKDGETGFRGYLVMKDSVFLEIYYTSRKEAIGLYLELRKMTAENPILQKNLDSLIELIRQKYEIMEMGIREFKRNNFELNEDMEQEAYHGKLVMDQLRNMISTTQDHEAGLLKKRDEELTSQFRTLDFITAASLVLALVLFASSFFVYMKENMARRDSEEKVDQYQHELRQRIEQLGTANKELIQMRSQEKFAATGRIARTIAHEIRNPLTNINLGVEQLRAIIGNSEETDTLTRLVLRNSNRINQLLTDLLQSTKISELNYSRASINQILDDALMQAADRMSLKGVKVVKKYSPDISELNVDREKLKIALLNILVNAMEAMQEGVGIITIQTRVNDEKCIVEISDNGSGMDSESLSKLFEPYFTTKPKGSGLGLANAQNIILNHRGSIYAESEIGKGSSFYISLNLD